MFRWFALGTAIILCSCGEQWPEDDASDGYRTSTATPMMPTETPEETATPVPEMPELPSYRPVFAHAMVQLWGTILIADGGASPSAMGTLQEITPGGAVVWGPEVFSWPHSARPNADMTALVVTETGDDRVLLLDVHGNILWNADAVSPLSDGSVLLYPNDAAWVDDGTVLITERDNHRVIQLRLDGTILWQFGVTGEEGDDELHLRGPHNGKLLPSGNLLVCDSGNNRVLEVTPEKETVWRYLGSLDWPRNADLLDNGNILITSSQDGRVLEVDRDGNTIWQVADLELPYDADRLPDGRTLVSTYKEILWIERDGSVSQCIPSDAC